MARKGGDDLFWGPYLTHLKGEESRGNYERAIRLAIPEKSKD